MLHGMDSDSLNHAVDYAAGAWVVRIQADAQAQVIPEKLRDDNLIGCPQSIGCLRVDSRNDFVEQAIRIGRVRNAYQISKFLERSSWIKSSSYSLRKGSLESRQTTSVSAFTKDIGP